jgi:molecular chaperone GrpE
MAKNEHTKPEEPETVETARTGEAADQIPEQGAPEVEETQAAPESEPAQAELDALKNNVAQQEEKYLRLCAEYDNYRKRTAKEKENAWTEAKAQTVAAFLGVYDNLERALKQETTDTAYAKGVEMTMKGLQDALTKLGVETIPAMGETFDPNRHNAVMHVEDETVGENTIVEVFQQGFTCGEKVIRFAMVKVAN